MSNFFHRLLNPHCEHCAMEEEKKFQRDSYNPTIELLKDEINRLQRINDSLVARLENNLNPVEVTDKPVESESKLPVPITPRKTSWEVKKRELEAEDRHRARVLRKLQESGVDVDKPMPLSDLEKEISDAKERIANAG